MQFQFRIDQQLHPDKEGFVILNGHQLAQRLKTSKGEGMRHLAEVITAMGQASAKAQSLKQVITTFERFVGTDNRIYLKVEENRVLGLLKVGEKNLFHRDYVRLQ
ncbi:MAG: GNAT family N-acetyltransferase [Actinobacteria bacterium]|nr:GNAT family N-acetyltransferase [Actinomycetota bacterium]